MDNSNLLLVTANVGTLFEDPLILMQQWIHEFMLTVKQLHPQFIALHLQEVGGKTYEQSSHYVKEFVKSLCEAYEMQEFSIVRIYLDENFNSQEQFTALGNLYFGHNTIPNSRLWNFKNCSWETTQGKNFYFGNIENVPTKDKSKFPLDFFPECKWSRKGFMRTRWNINGTILDFVNMHLFHDASNLTALIEFPSVYSQRRRKALIHTLQRFDMDKDNEIVPYFLFGDFNFRSDSAGVIKPLILMQQWIHEFMLTVKQLHPQFIALHLQEVGGKTYEQSSHYVKEFVKSLCEAYEMQEFSIVRIYLDENFNSQEQFTALGNLYFGHNTIPNSRLWNFKNCSWETTQGKNFYFGNIENVPTKDKSKFPLDFFPECKWSRKGFMRTRWNINGTILDFVNMHLFHDASNLTALIEFPSVYSQRRRKALIHTLQRFDMDKDNEIVPYFLFGDFNFRSDSAGVIKALTRNLTEHRLATMNVNNLKKQYRDENGKNILTIGKKEFHHIDHQNKFRGEWLKQYDRDLEICKGILFEYEITFSPSYPYEEKPELPTRYLTTRCPSWCDRVLMSAQMNEITINRNTSYNLIGDNICMGDHKPVYLNIQIKSNQGIIKPPVSVRKYLHHISNNLRSNDHTILKCPDKSEPTYQFIKLNKTRNITTQSNLDTGFSTNNMNEYIEIPSWINSIAGQAFTILRETFF